jgi:hypothetical protein
VNPEECVFDPENRPSAAARANPSSAFWPAVFNQPRASWRLFS